MTFKITDAMCLIAVPDANREDGFKYVDLGNYFTDSKGNKCLVTSPELAAKYSTYVKVPIYTHRGK
jgi:hypothetical protein